MSWSLNSCKVWKIFFLYQSSCKRMEASKESFHKGVERVGNNVLGNQSASWSSIELHESLSWWADRAPALGPSLRHGPLIMVLSGANWCSNADSLYLLNIPSWGCVSTEFAFFLIRQKEGEFLRACRHFKRLVFGSFYGPSAMLMTVPNRAISLCSPTLYP